jgi:hypothetical protein
MEVTMFLATLFVVSISMIVSSLMMLVYIEVKASTTPSSQPDSEWFEQGYAVKMPSELDEVMDWLEHYGERPF